MSKATPPVPRKVDPDLRRFLEALKEKTDVGEGQRGDPANRYLKVSDLLDLGIVKRLTERGPVGPGTWAPNIPLPNMAIPPKPTNFEVTDGFSYVFLTWERPTYSNHGFTEIWRSTDDNLGNATLIQQQIGQMFADPDVNYGQTYYYWIRFHSQSISGGGRAGPYNSTAGSPGQIAQDPEQLLLQLTDKITASQLHEDLKAPIAQIPSIIDDLTNEIEDRIAAVNTLLGDLGVIDDRVVAAESSITTLQSVAGDLSDGIDANAGAISALGTRVTDAEGTITVQAADITALESGLTNANNNITANAGALNALTTRVTTAEGSITVNSDSITSLTAILDNPTTGTSSLASAFSGLNTSITQVDNRVTVEAGRIDALSGQIDDPATGLTASFDAINVLEGRVTSTETGLVAEANARDELRVEILGDEVTDGALATSISDLQASVSSNYATISSVNQLGVNLDGRVGTIEERVSASGDLGKVSLQWSVKAQVGDLVGGIGLSNQYGSVNFYVQANTFSVYQPGQVGVKPFIIHNGQVFIDTAFIRDGTITNAKIGSLAVDNAKIASVNVMKIDGLDADFITARVTNLHADNITGDVNRLIPSASVNPNIPLIDLDSPPCYRRIKTVAVSYSGRPRWPIFLFRSGVTFTEAGDTIFREGLFARTTQSVSSTFSGTNANITMPHTMYWTWYSDNGGSGLSTTPPPANWLNATAGRMLSWPSGGGTVYARISSVSGVNSGSAGGSTVWYNRSISFSWLYCTGSSFSIGSSPTTFSIYSGTTHPVELLDSSHIYMAAKVGQESSSSSHLVGELTNGGFSFELAMAATRTGTVTRSRIDTIMIR